MTKRCPALGTQQFKILHTEPYYASHLDSKGTWNAHWMPRLRRQSENQWYFLEISGCSCWSTFTLTCKLFYGLHIVYPYGLAATWGTVDLILPSILVQIWNNRDLGFILPCGLFGSFVFMFLWAEWFVLWSSVLNLPLVSQSHDPYLLIEYGVANNDWESSLPLSLPEVGQERWDYLGDTYGSQNSSCSNTNIWSWREELRLVMLGS